MGQETEPHENRIPRACGEFRLAMTHGSMHMERDFRLAMTHESMHALEVRISDID